MEEAILIGHSYQIPIIKSDIARQCDAGLLYSGSFFIVYLMDTLVRPFMVCYIYLGLPLTPCNLWLFHHTNANLQHPNAILLYLW